MVAYRDPMLSKEAVLRHLGEVDDLVVAQVVDTGVSEEQLLEAIAEVERVAEEGEPLAPSSDPRVAKLRALLFELAREELEQGQSEEAY